MKARNSSLKPVFITIVLALIASASIATLRTKIQGDETVEILAERYYGDAKWAPILRAENRLDEGAQPKPGQFFKVPGPIIHEVQTGESLEDISDRFLEGEGSLELLAKANNLSRNAKLKRGDVITVFAEVKVKSEGKSAEEVAALYLGDENLGARVRRYNGVADGKALPAKVMIPLLGLEPQKPRPGQAAPQVAVATPVEPVPTEPVPTEPATPTEPTPTAPTEPAPVEPTIPVEPAPVEPTIPVEPAPDGPDFTDTPSAPNLDLSVPVTGKRATLEGFTHKIHTSMKVAGAPIGCLACHQRKSEGSIEHVAPKASDCLICHRESDAMPPKLRKGRPVRLALNTNHKVHLADDSKARELNENITCKSCHASDDQAFSGVGWGGHESCATCHVEGKYEPLVKGDRSGQFCLSCHGDVEITDKQGYETAYLRSHLVPLRGRAGDNAFDHQTHQTFSEGGNKSGKEISCTSCHSDVKNADDNTQINVVQMSGCVECHRQSKGFGLQPPSSCKDCHLHLRKGVPPAGDVIVKKPLDHTPFFRKNHEDAARTHTNLCASCHAGVDPNDGERCDTCHRVMKPRDHTAGYRDKVHGRMAQMDSTRCQTCHRAERCESCHRVIPNSHFPLSTFVDKASHASRARIDMGACLTCHRFENSCSRCHTGSP